MGPYTGPQESADAITHERYFLASDFISGVGYGIQAVLYVTCSAYLWRERKARRIYAFMLPYMTLLFLISSIAQVAQAHLVELAFVDNKNFPGGPWVYQEQSLGGIMNLLNTVAELALLFLSELFMIWRCWVVWFSAGRYIAYLIVLFPVLMLTVALITGVFLIVTVTHPASHLALLGGAHGIAWVSTYYSLIFGTNIIVTILILVRLIAHRRRVYATKVHGGDYMSLIAILIESSTAYSVIGAACLITYGVGSPVNLPFANAAIASQQISAYLIIARLAHGRAWQKDTAIHFGTNKPSASTSNSQIDDDGQIVIFAQQVLEKRYE
ncbi:hypothetical protein BD779DRAFT_200939 [Infundibulicybe gibba]|nr:hypothetical protein BD779DRAFT_200939 [Infundibulicybe gibba]